MLRSTRYYIVAMIPADNYIVAQTANKVLLSQPDRPTGARASPNDYHKPMNHEEVGRHWDENAEAWTELVRAGYDHYRDGLNTPAFLEMLPEVEGLSGLDVGCGEGHNTRLLARRGARVTGIDISGTFVRHAKEEEEREPRGIRYERASAVGLPFEEASFDFVTAFMSLMDIPESRRRSVCWLKSSGCSSLAGFSSSPSPTPASTRRTARTSATRPGAPTPSKSGTTSAGAREKSSDGSSPPRRRRRGKGCLRSAFRSSCRP